MVTLVACTDRASVPEFDHSVLRPLALSGVEVATDEPLISPVTLAITSEFVVIGDPGAERTVRFVSKGGATVGSVLSAGLRGDGPGEFRYVSRIRVDSRNGGYVWVYDPIARRLTRIAIGAGGSTLKGAVAGVRQLWDSIIVLQAPTGIRDLVWLRDSAIVGEGLRSDLGQLAYFDPKGQLVRTEGAFPGGRVPRAVRAQVYQGPMMALEDGTGIVTATRLSGSLASYLPTGRLLRRVNGPFPFDPTFHVIGRNPASGRPPSAAATIDQRLGYLDLSEYNGRILALFSGRRLGDFPQSSNVGNYVHVFDGELNYVCALKLDHDVIAIAADETGHSLYGLEVETIPALIRFDLTPQLC